MASIILDNVSIEFPIYSMASRSLKKSFVHLTTGGKISAEARGPVVVRALHEVSLRFEHGDRVGIIGHNGAGKSTLLRVVSEIYEPTSGVIQIDGKVSPLLDVMLGMEHESTGYENIIMRGILLGLTEKQIKRKMDDIANFSELGDYLSVPLRTYSTGMKVRLAFGAATSVDPEILVLDEVVGAGDAGFMSKAKKRLNKLVEKSSIVLFAAHSDEIIKRFCNKVLLLDSGTVRFFGDVDEGIEMYKSKREQNSD